MPSSIKIAKVGTNVCQILIKPYQKLPKEWNFAKSGHTAHRSVVDVIKLFLEEI